MERRRRAAIPGDIERHVYERMDVVSHVWPGYTLLNVWDLPARDWLYVAQCADQYVAKSKKGAGRG